MSIASMFRAKMDVALNSADSTQGKGADHRRAVLSRAFDAAELMLVEKANVTALFDKIAELQTNPPAPDAVRELVEALEIVAAGDVDVSNTAIIVGDGADVVLRQISAALASY